MSRKVLLFILRLLSVVTLAVMSLAGPGGWGDLPVLYRWILLGYTAWVLSGWAIPGAHYRRNPVLITLFIVDTVLALVLLQGLSSLYGELFLIYFVTIFVAVLAQSVSGGAAAAILSILLYAFLQYLRTGQYFTLDAVHLIRYPFILVTGVLCGFLAEEGRRDDSEKKRLRDTTQLLADKVDLATRKLIESNHSLKAMLEYHRRILSCIQTGIVVVHQDGRVKTFNEGAARITGFLEESVAGRAVTELPARLEPIAKALQRTLSEGKGYSLENLEITSARGEVLPVSLQTSVMRSENNDLLGAIATLKDISLLRQMEIQLTRSERLSALGEMAAGVAHEIKNPLNAIQGFSMRLSTKVQDPNLKKYADTIVQEVQRLDTIINDVLEYSRTTKLQKRPENLVELVEEVIRFAEEKFERAGIKIVRHYDESLPLVPMDYNKIKQVVLNLALNAVHAMSGGGTLTFRLSVANALGDAENPMPGEWVARVFLDQKVAVLSIQDTGCGIPRENLSKLFHPFFTTKTTGTGLGLSICHKLIEAHGGTIAVQSVVGMGTTFSIQLPISD